MKNACLIGIILTLCLVSGLVLAQNTPPKPAVVDPSVPILNQINDVSCILYAIILYSSTAITAFLVVLAGLEYTTSEGDPVKRDRAKTRVIYAFVGLFIVILACPFIDYIVTNTKILPFQRSCDCMAGKLKTTTTTTIATTTTTTSKGDTTTTTSGSTSSTSTSTTTSSSTTTSTIAPSLVILYIPVDWSGGMSSFDSQMNIQANTVLNNIPLKACPAKFKVIKSHTICNANIPADFNTCWSNAQNIFDKIETCAKATGEKYDYLIGFSPSTLCGGRGFSSAGSGIIYLAAPSYEYASIHELAHEWDIGDEYYDTCRCFGSYFPNYKYNCLDASIGGKDYYTGFSSAYCAGGSQCPSFGELSCLGNKNPSNTRCIMGYDGAGVTRSFCTHCSAHINSISFLNC